jgi:replicative DNA helicase
MAREMGVPVLCLAQVNRQADDSKGKNPPRLSHLRESGAIEQDADVVMFVYREEAYRKDGDMLDDKGESIEGRAELIVGKQRNGPTGTVHLYFHKPYTLFESLARRGPES